MNLINVKQAAAFLKEGDGYLIYTHANPDGDTIGSAVALVLVLRAMGKKAFAFCIDEIPEKLSFMPLNGVFIESEPEDASEYTLVSVDVAGERVLGNAKNKSFALSIDHHKTNTVDCENLLVMADRIACGEIIFLIMDSLGVKITKDMAVALYGAICSDSGGFKYDAVKPETHVMAAKCLETGIDHAEINRQLFESKTKSQVELIKTAYKNLELLCGGKYAIVSITSEEAEACGAVDADFECINPIPREIKGVLASAVIRNKKDGIKVSMRSSADIDVAEIASRFGGGGHYHAAGFTLGDDFEKALETVRNIFTELEG
ncbi:MAG: hypothetical protein E7586_06225 [Ruminococcaceae bacterium]|nr:hypothetical protein [Oscillospiraceae bacterium]